MKIRSILDHCFVSPELVEDSLITFKRSGVREGKPVYEADLPDNVAEALIAASPKTFFPFDGPRIPLVEEFPEAPAARQPVAKTPKKKEEKAE